jgi:hypothetical protein
MLKLHYVPNSYWLLLRQRAQPVHGLGRSAKRSAELRVDAKKPTPDDVDWFAFKVVVVAGAGFEPATFGL